MREGEFVTIKNAKLNNHCPECYSTEGLQLTFSQRFVETSLYKSLTSEVRQLLSCTNCETIIFPVNWTPDIERVVEYQQKAFTPKATSFKLKKTAWILFITVDIIILLVVLIAFDVIKL